MSQTKKQVLTKLYVEFYNEINCIVNLKSIFPAINDMDIVDLVYLLTHYFGLTDNYKPVVIDLMKSNNIILDDATFDKAYAVIERFLIIFKQI
jgi:hypothetical protein